jgi:hypothetical protein
MAATSALGIMFTFTLIDGFVVLEMYYPGKPVNLTEEH